MRSFSCALLGILLPIVLTQSVAAQQDAAQQDPAKQDTAQSNSPQQQTATWSAGFSKVDVTPTEPVRMAGYGSRDRPSEGVDTPLFVRAFALQAAAEESPAVLISVDTIGLPGSLTRELAEQVQQKHGIDRERLVFSSTHTHCGPDLVSELSNIFSTELSEQEQAAGRRYKEQLIKGIRESIELAIADLAPAQLQYASGEIGFAANRRVLTDGRWSGFGVQSDGPVDHSVPVLKITSADGKVRGIVFNYACHCTTLGGDHYRINGEWAGYATMNLEAVYSDAVALCTIGCGADANPEPRGSLDATILHGRAMATEVANVIEGEMQPIDAPLDTRFDYAALTFDLPTAEELKQRVANGDTQTRRHAQQLLQVLERKGRLPETYPVPIQSWQFGDQLTMIFLGGEVVVDYALRLKKELDDPNLWVTAYANDVLGYIASERMRQEGGYEYDRSGVFYGLPGPWASGSEDKLISRILELLKSRGRSRPTEADQSLQKFHLLPGFEIELVAAEPLIEDPINIAFDATGRMWVVEMGDYPEGEGSGRIKTLTDTDADGTFDQVQLFLDNLSFPTGVMPWGDGVLITSAPNLLFARDQDGDGKADQIETLVSGFKLANPQHRISGFTYGLDHSVHLSSGDNLGDLTMVESGETIDASGHDVKVWPDSGEVAVTNGRTQYIRSRNDWGQWFGNDNSRPMYHYVIDHDYFRRNSAVAYGGMIQQLFEPAVAPPVYPVTAATERFNDLFAANRFTSACSSIIARSPAWNAAEHETAYVCEPVHNLVHRSVLIPDGASFRAERAESEATREFLASADPWFRPVRVLVGPDDNLYVVDMYRETIEHPEWIPDAWQAQLDLRAGERRGRIYRVVPADRSHQPETPLAELNAAQLVQQLRSPVGPRRDLAQQMLLHKGIDDEAEMTLAKLAADDSCPHGQVHALSMLRVTNRLSPSQILDAMKSPHAGVLLTAIPLAEQNFAETDHQQILDLFAVTATHEDARVRLQTALSLGEFNGERAGQILAQMLSTDEPDQWIATAVSSSAVPHAVTILDRLISNHGLDALEKLPDQLVTDLLKTAQSTGVPIADRYRSLFEDKQADLRTQLRLADSFVQAIGGATQRNDATSKLFEPLYERAIETVADPQQSVAMRQAAIKLINIGIGESATERTLLLHLITPRSPIEIQLDAIDRLMSFSDDETAAVLFDRWTAMSEQVRGHLVTRMLRQHEWTLRLLSALEAGEIEPNQLSPASRQQLTYTGSRSMRVRAQRLLRGSGSLEKRQLIGEYLQHLQPDRDPGRGAELYKQHCAVCHSTDDQGSAIGASLDNLTDRTDPALLTAILDPNRSVDPKYQAYVVRTDDDLILTGVIESEVGNSLTLAHSDGKRTTLNRTDIADMKNTGVSLMPEELERVLPPEAMQDLLAYLQQKPKQ